jgi:hypothetical protein
LPSIVAVSERGSTPAPASADGELEPGGALGAGVSSLTLGGVTSFTQKRNVYGPVRAPAVVSKTTSYDPAPGRIAPATGRGAPKESTYGLITSGRPG